MLNFRFESEKTKVEKRLFWEWFSDRCVFFCGSIHEIVLMFANHQHGMRLTSAKVLWCYLLFKRLENFIKFKIDFKVDVSFANHFDLCIKNVYFFIWTFVYVSIFVNQNSLYNVVTKHVLLFLFKDEIFFTNIMRQKLNLLITCNMSSGESSSLKVNYKFVCSLDDN